VSELQRYLVVDLEATCCDRGSVPREQMEIIELGAVMLDPVDFHVVDEFQSFVRPVRHPKLTAFCTRLTTIEQRDVDDAPTFVEFIGAVRSWLERYSDYAFCSWGDYDRKQLQRDCDFHRVPNPIDAPHLNLKRAFADRYGLRKPPGLGEAMRLAGLKFDGTAHRGIDDARNIARLVPYVFGSLAPQATPTQGT
jgi:inhibitor of KinA sporulation pathway (predicted exonuclease)